MNRQETFDKVVKHLLLQNKQSVSIRGCLYRGPDGLKCAVGCLIQDEVYTSDLEHKSVDNPDAKAALELSLGCNLTNDDIFFLSLLQKIHDGHKVEAWPIWLGHFAQSQGLRYNPPV
jgi:hypothetical protein